MTKKTTSSGNQVGIRLLTFWIGVTILLLTVVSGCTQRTSGLGDAEKAAIREMKGIAAAAANLLNVYMDARVTDVRAFSATCERLKQALTTPEARSEASRVLQEWQNISGAYDVVLLLDNRGVCVAASSDGLVNRDFSTDSSFKDAVSGNVAIADAHKSDAVAFVDPVSKGWTLGIAAPLVIGQKVGGVLVCFLKWSKLKELTSHFTVGETGYAFVLNGQNQAIVHPSTPHYGMSLLDPRINLPELDDAVRNKASHTRYKYRIVATATGASGSGTAVIRSGTKLVGLAYPEKYGNFPGLDWTVGARSPSRNTPLR